MRRTFNKNQMLALVSGGAMAVLLIVPAFYSIPVWARIVTLMFSGSFLYLTLRFVWIIAEPEDASISMKARASEVQAEGLCPVCAKNRQGRNMLTVGYRKPTQLALHLGGIDPLLLGEGLANNLQVAVPICDRCAWRFGRISRLGFFAPSALDFRFRVLKKKPGYLRGLRHPFEPSYLERAVQNETPAMPVR